MIRDIAFHLSTRATDTAAIDYAVSVATGFEAHVAGIAFALEPFVPPTAGMGEAIPSEWTDQQREEIAGHLARHDLKIGVERIVAPDGDVADTDFLAVTRAILTSVTVPTLRVGGYGHSRLREFVLGSAP